MRYTSIYIIDSSSPVYGASLPASYRRGNGQPRQSVIRCMAQIIRKLITVFEFRFRGHILATALSAQELRRECPRRLRAKIVSHEESVGIIQGEVHDWNKGGGQARHLKLHWNCPQCGHHHWGDLIPGETNPCLWFSECKCIDKWLISYPTNVKPY